MQSENGAQLSLVRPLLRSSTAALHHRLDDRMARLLRLGEAGYAEFLIINAAAVMPLEQALADADVEAILPDWNLRARSAALRSDLESLSLPSPDLANAGSVLERSDEAYRFGVLYVLEGSRLGAKVIRRALETASRSWPTRYLSHGEGQPLWQTFVARLEASHAVQNNPEVVIAGANAGFQLFLDAALQSTAAH